MYLALAMLLGVFVPAFLLRTELSCLPSFDQLILELFSVKVPYFLGVLVPGALLFVFPVLFCGIVIKSYDKYSRYLRKSSSAKFRYALLILAYSYFLEICIIFYIIMDALSSSKTLYFIYRLECMFDRAGKHATDIYYSLFVILLMNAFSFLLLFFVSETVIATRSPELHTSIFRFLTNNIRQILAFLAVIACYVVCIVVFESTYLNISDSLISKHGDGAFKIGAAMGFTINGIFIPIYTIIALE